MKTLAACTPRQSVLEGSEDFVVNLSAMPALSEAEAKEFLDSNVLTAGMEELIMQAFDRLSGGPSRGIFKLSEAMGGGKTQSMIVAGLLARYPSLIGTVAFKKSPAAPKVDHVIAFTGRSTDENVWVSIGKQLSADFPEDAAPSEKQWASLFKGKSVLVLLDELAFYLVHAASKGSKEQGERFSTLTAVALTNLFGAVRDHKDAAKVAVVVADLQKDWDQGHDDLARIMRSNITLGGTIQSADNEMSKGAISISPVDNTKDELYAILRRRLFKSIDITDADKNTVIDAYYAELETAKKAGLIDRALPTIREELKVSYPFHFSTKNLIETFNDNPGFQKTRDVIRLMAAIIRSIWEKGQAEVERHTLLSLASPDLNVSAVSSRFKEINKSLEGALQTDIANSGTSYAESLAKDTVGLSVTTAKWIFAASLSVVRPRGLSKEELAEYLTAPGVDLSGLGQTLDELYRNCWYIDLYRSGRYFFNKVKNLNAQLNSYVNTCSDIDRDGVIETKLKEMFEPNVKRCYQRIYIHEDFSKIQLERDKVTLIICAHDAPYQKFFENEKFKNRVAFLPLINFAGLQKIRNHARRYWAIEQVLKDMSKDDAQYEKAKDERTNIQADLFISLRSVYSRLLYPLGNSSTGDTKLQETDLQDSYTDPVTGHTIKFESKDSATKGELVVESTLRNLGRFNVIEATKATDKVKAYRSLRIRVEDFLFPSSGRASWDQILDSAASRGIMTWTEPGTIDRMKDVLVSTGEWREEAGQVLKPPFEELTALTVEYERNPKTGSITTTDIKLLHADTLMVSEDGGPMQKIPHSDAFTSDAMVIVLQAKDSTGKNKEGKPYRIENSIDIQRDFLPSTTEGHRTLRLKVIPADASIKWTTDGSDPANNGKPYNESGVDVKEGATVKIFAEKATKHSEVSFPVPKEAGKDGSSTPSNTIDPHIPVKLHGKVVSDLGLSSRKSVYSFLSKLPDTTTLVGVRAKVVKAETDNTVAVAWDGKTEVTPERILKAYEFLDSQLADAEWELPNVSQILFATGKNLIEWQKAESINIAPNLITQ